MATLVHVIFVDADSGATFAQVDISPDRLPATFAEPTTMHLGEDPWFVVRAEPLTAAEFARTGHLRLEMRRVAMMDPKQILFSLPTLADELPACEVVDANGGLVLHEDDWRQVEIVTEGCAAEIQACVTQIERIYREHQKPSGAFDALHVRSEVPEPLRGVALALDVLRAHLAGSVGMGDVVVAGQGRVRDGFALRLSSGICVYGSAPAGLVRVLGLVFPENMGEVGADAAALAKLMAGNHLLLVDWCRASVVPADRDAVLVYLQRD